MYNWVEHIVIVLLILGVLHLLQEVKDLKSFTKVLAMRITRLETREGIEAIDIGRWWEEYWRNRGL
jgi:hypothetical protein